MVFECSRSARPRTSPATSRAGPRTVPRRQLTLCMGHAHAPNLDAAGIAGFQVGGQAQEQGQGQAHQQGPDPQGQLKSLPGKAGA